MAPLNKQTYYRKTLTVINTMGFKDFIIRDSRGNGCQIFMNGNEPARTRGFQNFYSIFAINFNKFCLMNLF